MAAACGSTVTRFAAASATACCCFHLISVACCYLTLTPRCCCSAQLPCQPLNCPRLPASFFQVTKYSLYFLYLGLAAMALAYFQVAAWTLTGSQRLLRLLLLLLRLS